MAVALSMAAASFALNHLVPRWSGMQYLDDAFVGLLAAVALEMSRRHLRHKREVELRQLTLVAELNHHVRNSLCSILLNANCADPEKRLERIKGSVEKIDFVLSELVPTAGTTNGKPRFFVDPKEKKQSEISPATTTGQLQRT